MSCDGIDRDCVCLGWRCRKHLPLDITVGAWTRVDGHWRHRPVWKMVVNSALRFFQRRGPGRKLVVFTRCTTEGDPPTVLGYGIGMVEHLE